MKILVTGGAGFIGSAVVRLAIARGYSVVNLDALTYAGCLENVASVSQHSNYAFQKADIRNRKVLDAIFSNHSPDMVILRFPSWDCLPYDRISPQSDISAMRMAISSPSMAQGPANKKKLSLSVCFICGILVMSIS